MGKENEICLTLFDITITDFQTVSSDSEEDKETGSTARIKILEKTTLKSVYTCNKEGQYRELQMPDAT